MNWQVGISLVFVLCFINGCSGDDTVDKTILTNSTTINFIDRQTMQALLNATNLEKFKDQLGDVDLQKILKRADVQAGLKAAGVDPTLFSSMTTKQLLGVLILSIIFIINISKRQQ